MDISESSELHDSSDEEYVPSDAPTTSRGAAKRRRRSGHQTQSRRRKMPRLPRTSQRPRPSQENLTEEDAARVEGLRMQRVNFERERIANMSQHEAQNVLQRVLEREPGVIFDVLLETTGPVAGGNLDESQPSWCVCTNCKEMPTDIEKKCCQQHPQLCISKMPHMEAFILEEGVLRLARRLWNDLRALFDDSDPGDDNRQFRHAAYRQYVAWQYGRLGAGNRIVIPSCVVWAIRNKYPDCNGQYTGFIPRRL